MKLPQPDSDALAYSEALKRRIAGEIAAAGGWIGFDRFMELALYAPGMGYYSGGAHKFGAAGDFVTAPEITPLFSQALAAQAVQIMALSAPQIIEVGAGSGRLAADLLLELEQRGALPERYAILDLSGELRERQRKTIEQRAPHLLSRVAWLDRLPAHFDGLVLANELLDALPIHLVQWQENAILERGVAWENGQFIWHERPAQGRLLDRAQALAAVQEAAQAFETFNLDIMYALPGQTLAGLERDLETALSFAPPHLSVYHLTIEPNTWFAKHPPTLPEGDEAYAMLDRITEMTAAAGLARYEVSAYARKGHQCVHNSNYWQFGDYLGICAGAHSKLSFAHRIVRQVRYREPRLYMDNALAGCAVAQDEDVRRADLPFEYMLNALRLREGFALQDFCERTGLAVTAIARGLDEAERKGLVVRDMGHVRPTERGFDFLSDLQALFLAD